MSRSSAAETSNDVPNEFACQPEERLLEVVVRLGRDLEILEVLFPVEGDGTGVDLALLLAFKRTDHQHVSLATRIGRM